MSLTASKAASPSEQKISNQVLTLEALRQQKTEILAIFERHGCFDVRVFGSVVRGEATAESDVDFLCDYDLEKTSGFFPGGLVADLEELLNISVDIVFPNALDARYIGETIQQDLVVL